MSIDLGAVARDQRRYDRFVTLTRGEAPADLGPHARGEGRAALIDRLSPADWAPQAPAQRAGAGLEGRL